MSQIGEQIMIVAAAKVNGDAAAPTWLTRDGFTGAIPTRTAAGTYTLTLVQPVDTAFNVPLVSLIGTSPAVGRSIEVNQTADDTFVVTMSDGAALFDGDFSIVIFGNFNGPGT